MSVYKQTLLKNLKDFLPTHFSRKRAFELLIIMLGLGAIMWLTTLITPYKPEAQVSFYTPDTKVALTHYRAQVKSINGTSIDVKVLDGERSGETVSVVYNKSFRSPSLAPGNIILVNSDTITNKLSYVDKFRLPGLIILIALFIVIVLIVGRKRGLTSLAGLGVSVIVVGWFIVPLILAGRDAFWVSIIGAYIIAFSSILIAHGRKPRTFISIACVSIVLSLVAVISQLAITLLGLSGIDDDASSHLALVRSNIDIAGILAGGIVIASLGVLDDIVTAQVATVDELQKANTKLSVRELYKRASSVGGEHIASLVNTLALVYVGAALPVIISLTSYNNDLLLLFNSEFIATEVVRTIIASTGLVLAVPVSTVIAATILHKRHTARQATSVKTLS